MNFHRDLAEGRLEAIWQPHNEHRIVLTRLLNWLDFELFGARKVFLAVAVFASMAVMAAALAAAARQVLARPGDRAARSGTSPVVVALGFAWMQHENITMGCQSQAFLVLAFPVLAYLALARAHGPPGPDRPGPGAWLAIAVGLGLLAVGTQANGLATLWILLGMELRLAGPGPRAALVAAVALAATGAYFHDYHPAPQPDAAGLLARGELGELAGFLLAFLGGPVYHCTGSVRLAQAGGLLLALAGAGCAVRGWGRQRAEPAVLALHGVLAHSLASALAVTWGRAGQGVMGALVSRYTSQVLVAWAMVLILARREFGDAPGRTRAGSIAVLLAVALLLAPGQRDALFDDAPGEVLRRESAALAVELDAPDREALGAVYTMDQFELFSRFAGYARARHLGIFGEPRLSGLRELLGRAAGELGLVPCQGALDIRSACQGAPGWERVVGWAYDLRTRRIPAAVLFVDPAGIVVGAALTGSTRPDLARGVDAGALHAGLVGFVRAAAPASGLTLAYRP